MPLDLGPIGATRTPFDDLRCVDCGHLWSEHSHIPDDPSLHFVMDNSTAEEVRRHLVDLTAERDTLKADAERLRSELAGLRRYLTRSIADDIGQKEAAEISAALSNEDAALIDRWIAAMENPAYAASDAARLRRDVWDLSESNISLDRNLKDCVGWMSALEPILNVDMNALRLEPDRAAALETVRQAVQADPGGFIVRLESGVWIAEWKGDPGRTTVKASARSFPTERSARRALSKARRFREFPKAVVERAT